MEKKKQEIENGNVTIQIQESPIDKVTISGNKWAKKSYLRNHIGESIIVRILEDCYKNNIKYLTLEVRVSNEPAIKLYTKYGFNSLGTRKGYYQDNNEDALIMWTENIFYDKFKTKFNENVEKLKSLINIK